MSQLYTVITELCAQKGITITELCRQSGASRASLSDLKMGRKASLSASTLSKIAATLEVSVDYLLGNATAQAAGLINGDEELTEYLEQLKTRPEMRMLFSLTKGASKEDVEKAVRIIEAALGK
ncbi:MAG: XRE family transcriptional regulator [Pygmaiobacter massiliensis]|nr:XRE family transcriptional regulator [Pygmaiobacter massiliensis]